MKRQYTYKYGSSGTTGAMGELLVAVDLTEKGFDVFRALSPSATCDLIAVRHGKCYRVEVTTGKQGKSGLTWPTHDPNRYDILALLVDGAVVYPTELPYGI